MIKTIRPKVNFKTKPLNIDDVENVFKELPSIESKVYFLLLAECGLGLKLSEPFVIKLQDIDFKRRYIRTCKLEETEHEFITFIHEETVKFIREKYLPVRNEFVKTYVANLGNLSLPEFTVKNWQKKLIPFDRNRLRREIKEVARKALGRDFEPYELRKFFSTWMIMNGVPGTIVNTLTGKAPSRECRALIEYYWTPKHEEPKKWYEKYAPKICC